MAKGQVEFVVIIGIVIVASVVILYAYQPAIITPPPTGKYAAVKASVESLVRDGSQETMRKLSLYGGYLDNSSFPLGSVTFLGKQVPYWQYNGKVQAPDVRANFAKGLKSYLSDNKDGMLQAMKTSGVTLGDPQVAANFLPGKITVTVNMATEIDGQSISSPYVVDVQTQMQEINDFSTGFAQYDSDQRPFEYYTLSSMMMSPITQDVHDVPFLVFVMDCGNYVFKGFYDVKPAMEYAIKVTLASTYMPGKAPQNTMMTSPNPKYAIPAISGKRFEDLDVSFQLPDDFQVTQSNFQFSPNPISAIPKMIPMTGQCQSDPLYVKYYFSYPVIARVKDPITQNVFQFALNVYVKDNKPGDWSSASGYQNDLQSQICSNPQCSARITIKSGSGAAVSSASVSFMGCQIGQTDSQGALSGPAPCGIGPLQVYREGYDMYAVMQSSDALRNGVSLTVAKVPAIRVHFYQVIVENMSLSGNYQIADNSVSPLGQNQSVYMVFQDASGNTFQRGFNTQSGLLNTLPAGSYVVSATLLSKADELGGIIAAYSFQESLDGKDLYVYLPVTSDYKSVTDSSQKASATAALSGVLNKCGYGPIAASEVKLTKGCSVGYNEV